MMFKGVPCPKCGKKGLSYSDHPHAFGWKDYDHATCRYCGRTFKVKQRHEEPPSADAVDPHALSTGKPTTREK